MEQQYNLERFLTAQDRSWNGYADALHEIVAGCKTGHWMWYIFPQLKGLGTSEISLFYGLAGYAEARAYYDHPVLRQRLLEIAAALLTHPKTEITDLLGVNGAIDAKKLRSCMTLFALVDPEEPLFRRVLDTFFNGQEDRRTVQLAECL